MTRTYDPVRNVVIPHLDGKPPCDCPKLPSSKVGWVWVLLGTDRMMALGIRGEYHASKGSPQTVDRCENDTNIFLSNEEGMLEYGTYDDDATDELPIEEQLTIIDLEELMLAEEE